MQWCLCSITCTYCSHWYNSHASTYTLQYARTFILLCSEDSLAYTRQISKYPTIFRGIYCAHIIAHLVDLNEQRTTTMLNPRPSSVRSFSHRLTYKVGPSPAPSRSAPDSPRASQKNGRVGRNDNRRKPMAPIVPIVDTLGQPGPQR